MELKEKSYADTTPPPVLSLLAMTGFVLGLASWASLFFGGFLMPFRQDLNAGPYGDWTPFMWAGLVMSIAGGSASVLAFARILQSSRRQSGLPAAALGVATSLIGFLAVALTDLRL